MKELKITNGNLTMIFRYDEGFSTYNYCCFCNGFDDRPKYWHEVTPWFAESMIVDLITNCDFDKVV